MSSDSSYQAGVVIVGGLTAIVVFVGAWIYCISEYGFLLGVGLGWLPAVITAIIVGALVGFLWPLIALGIGISVLYNLNH